MHGFFRDCGQEIVRCQPTDDLAVTDGNNNYNVSIVLPGKVYALDLDKLISQVDMLIKTQTCKQEYASSGKVLVEKLFDRNRKTEFCNAQSCLSAMSMLINVLSTSFS